MYGKVYVYEATKESSSKPLIEQEFSDNLLGVIQNRIDVPDFDVVTTSQVFSKQYGALCDLLYGRSADYARNSGLNAKIHIYSEDHRKKLNSLKKIPIRNWDKGLTNITQDDRENIFFNYKKVK